MMTPIAQREGQEKCNILFKALTIYEVIDHLQVNGDKFKMYTINSKHHLKKIYPKSPFKKKFSIQKKTEKKDQRTDEVSRKQY